MFLNLDKKTQTVEVLFLKMLPHKNLSDVVTCGCRPGVCSNLTAPYVVRNQANDSFSTYS